MNAETLSGRRILIVEDEYLIASDLKRLLSRAEAKVVGPVGDVDAGLRLVEDNRPDAAILDVNLEGTFSYPLADWLSDRNIPYAFVTGYDAWSLPERYQKAPQITKPFAPDTILTVVAKLCTQGEQL